MARVLLEGQLTFPFLKSRGPGPATSLSRVISVDRWALALDSAQHGSIAAAPRDTYRSINMSADNAKERDGKAESKACSLRRLTDDSVSAEVTTEIEGFRVLGLSSDDIEFYNGFDAEKRKRLVRKIDVRLIPVLTILYLIAHIDRANIGNAKIEGLVEDLGLTGNQYNIALTVFFPPYILFMLPSNILLKRFRRPSVYLGALISIWGTVMTCTGLVHNFTELVTARFLLGLFE